MSSVVNISDHKLKPFSNKNVKNWNKSGSVQTYTKIYKHIYTYNIIKPNFINQIRHLSIEISLRKTPPVPGTRGFPNDFLVTVLRPAHYPFVICLNKFDICPHVNLYFWVGELLHLFECRVELQCLSYIRVLYRVRSKISVLTSNFLSPNHSFPPEQYIYLGGSIVWSLSYRPIIKKILEISTVRESIRKGLGPFPFQLL